MTAGTASTLARHTVQPGNRTSCSSVVSREVAGMKRETLLRFTLLVALSLAAGGCYTVLTHPQTTPEQHVTDTGDVLAPNDCSGCHSGSELWSYHHDAYWLAPSHHSSLSGPSHRNSLSGYYAYRYDHLFVGHRWYNRRYYDRWAWYYYQPWWMYDRHPQRGDHYGRPAEQRPTRHLGDRRDGYDRQEPRSEFTPYIGPGTGPMTFSSPLQPAASTGSTGRARTTGGGAEVNADTSNERKLGDRRADPPAAAPTTTQPSSSGGSRPAQDGASSDSNDDGDDEQPQRRRLGDRRR